MVPADVEDTLARDEGEFASEGVEPVGDLFLELVRNLGGHGRLLSHHEWRSARARSLLRLAVLHAPEDVVKSRDAVEDLRGRGWVRVAIAGHDPGQARAEHRLAPAILPVARYRVAFTTL